MMAIAGMQKEVDMLIGSLGSRTLGQKGGEQLAQNVVYYVPRVRDLKQLEALVKAVFQSPVWGTTDVFHVFEMAQAIIQWKLEISEPSLDVATFYRAWDGVFTSAQSWSVAQLGLLAGVLSTRQRYVDVQRAVFVDDSGRCEELYAKWRAQYFLPVWGQLLARRRSDPSTVDILALLYAVLSDEHDHGLEWGLLAQSLFRQAARYMLTKNESGFAAVHLDAVGVSLKRALAAGTPSIAAKILENACHVTYELAQREMNSLGPRPDYAARYYSNTMFVVVLLLEGCLSNGHAAPAWRHQALMCLFYINFIVHGFGKDGFNTYQRIYQNVLSVLESNIEVFHASLGVLDGNIWPQGNWVNDSRILFMLEYMETGLAAIPLTGAYVQHSAMPIIERYMHASNAEIREGAYAVQLALLRNACPETTFVSWKMQHLKPLLDTGVAQFVAGQLSETQLVALYQAVVSQLPLLSLWNADLPRELLQFTYQKILQFPKIPTKAVLCECLILQCQFVKDKYLSGWLDNCLELIAEIPQPQHGALIGKLWELIKRSRNDLAIRWWYTKGLKNRL
ncbi:AER208Cp [Eremothecium gossypii ATCC 10895]|uniref:AER208Cp n=1 Tax=Eremothecium gossypii (strain ATCC 10895 / CBS 109.51 / FGSC 9923 / NRRL Y-1056) TaxID=284811 RepID=Q756P6_EREGS|nr:AER208Cp [Eremothecium gossypii ATCC 10895]AAS52889.2 AER208Cp [Eremothecium gossypii ATCC 10895]AEY97197.1 FAER208Cp [Eremothecium gossypii FDAG1]